MKVSIITATYNSAKTIESSLQSVENQTYPFIEHLIIDGASKDRTVQIVEAYQSKNKTNIHYTSSPDKGIYDALNKGIEKATGEVIGFLHSDDSLDNIDVIQDIVNCFEKHRCDGVYGDLKYVNAEDTSKVVRYWKSSFFKKNLLQKGWMPAHPTLFLKKDVYKVYGKYDLNFKIAADYDFMLRILKKKNLSFIYLSEVITNMRLGGASNQSLKNIFQKSKEDLQALRKNNIGGWRVLIRKNLSKIPQFFKRN